MADFNCTPKSYHTRLANNVSRHVAEDIARIGEQEGISTCMIRNSRGGINVYVGDQSLSPMRQALYEKTQTPDNPLFRNWAQNNIYAGQSSTHDNSLHLSPMEWLGVGVGVGVGVGGLTGALIYNRLRSRNTAKRLNSSLRNAIAQHSETHKSGPIELGDPAKRIGDAGEQQGRSASALFEAPKTPLPRPEIVIPGKAAKVVLFEGSLNNGPQKPGTGRVALFPDEGRAPEGPIDNAKTAEHKVVPKSHKPAEPGADILKTEASGAPLAITPSDSTGTNTSAERASQPQIPSQDAKPRTLPRDRTPTPRPEKPSSGLRRRPIIVSPVPPTEGFDPQETHAELQAIPPRRTPLPASPSRQPPVLLPSSSDLSADLIKRLRGDSKPPPPKGRTPTDPLPGMVTQPPMPPQEGLGGTATRFDMQVIKPHGEEPIPAKLTYVLEKHQIVEQKSMPPEQLQPLEGLTRLAEQAPAEPPPVPARASPVNPNASEIFGNIELDALLQRERGTTGNIPKVLADYDLPPDISKALLRQPHVAQAIINEELPPDQTKLKLQEAGTRLIQDAAKGRARSKSVEIRRGKTPRGPGHK